MPVSFIKGRGIWLWDNLTHSPYLDALSGRGVCNLGHNHPKIVEALKNQADQLIHTSNLYRIPQQEQLATVLCERFSMVQAFFSNSGAESVEAALKIACRDGNKKSIQYPIIISVEGSYHGRTLAALHASGSKQLTQEKLALGLCNNQSHIICTPLNDIEALRNTICHYHSNIVAIIIEPILGDGGIRPCSNKFLQAIRTLCDEHDYLMLADEIQTGLCRTGNWSACEEAGIQPDILMLAKALGNGFPIGAYLVNKRAQNLLDGYHGSTFSGNPLGCSVALSVVETLTAEKNNLQVQHKGEYLKERLETGLSHNPIVHSIRGKGLMLGIELKHPCASILHTALRHQLLFDVVDTHTIRLLPPLIITLAEIDELVKRFVSTVEEYAATTTITYSK